MHTQDLALPDSLARCFCWGVSSPNLATLESVNLIVDFTITFYFIVSPDENQSLIFPKTLKKKPKKTFERLNVPHLNRLSLHCFRDINAEFIQYRWGDVVYTLCRYFSGVSRPGWSLLQKNRLVATERLFLQRNGMQI